MLSNSFEIFRQLSELDINHNIYMVSYNISSLFTNVPNDETIDIITNLIYDNNDHVRGMSKEDFKVLLDLAINDTYFIFNNEYYKQVDGLAMGIDQEPRWV